MALLVNTGFDILVGLIYRLQIGGKALLVIAASGALLLGLALLDAAFAFIKRPGVTFAATTLFACVAANLGAGILGMVAVWRMRYSGVASILKS